MMDKIYYWFLTAPKMLLVIILSVLIIIIGFVGNSVTNDLEMSPDSMRYSLVADQIELGHGLRIPIAYYDSVQKLDELGTTPFTVQPPGYPLALSLFRVITNNAMTAAGLINWLSFMIIVLVTGCITWRNTDWIIGALAAITFAFSLPLLKVADMYWSDLLFMTITMIGIWMAIEADGSESPNKLIVFAGILTAFAILIRFPGIALIPILLLGTLKCYIRSRKVNVQVILWLSSVLAPTLLFFGLLFRNYQLTGAIRGFMQPPQDRTFVESFYGSINSLLFDNFFVYDIYTKITITAGIAFGIACLLILWNGYPDFRKDLHRKLTTTTGLMLMLFMASYFTLMLIALTNNQPHFESRFYSPLIPVIFILIYLIMHSVINKYRHHSSPIAFILIILSVSFVIANTWNSYRHLPDLRAKIESTKFTKSCVLNWLNKQYGITRLLTNEPYKVAYYSGISTVRIPSRAWNNKSHIVSDSGAELPNVMRKHNVDFIALFTGGNKLSEEHFGQTISGLSIQEFSIEQLELVYSCEDGLIYHLMD